MSRPAPRGPRLFGLLLWLYPRRYRRRFGADMRTTFDDKLAAARSEGRPALRRLWRRTATDVVRTALAERWRSSLDERTVVPDGGRAAAAGGGLIAGWRIRDDLRFGARTLRRAPAFAAAATLTLALGIGATTAAFSVLDRVVLRPLPYPGAERMFLVGLAREGASEQPSTVSAPLMMALQESVGPAEAIVGISRGSSVLTGLGEPERVRPQEVTAGFFAFIGARPHVGRVLGDQDHAPGAPRVAVLGHGFWMDRFGGDPAAVGAAVVLDGVPHTVVGILPRAFVPPEGVMSRSEGDIWVPLPLAERLAADAESQALIYTTWAVARLPQGRLAGEMTAHMARLFDDVEGRFPRGMIGVAAQDLHTLTVGDIASMLWRVFAAVALLLIIACVNVASLLLTRASGRAGEFAIRSALGAGRLRLVRQLLCESLLLALAAGTLGAWIAFLVVEGFRRFSPAGPGGVPRLAEGMVDGRVLAFSIAVAVASVVFFGLLPALRATARVTPTGRQSTPGRADGRLRALFVLGETALAVVLVVGSGLLVHDLVRRVHEDPGYRPEGLISVAVNLPFERYGYGGVRATNFWRDLLDRMRALPNVSSAALTSEVPTTGFSMGRDLTPEGHLEGEMISMVRAGDDFGSTVGIALTEGRWFTQDASDGEVPVVVNQALVDAYWPGSGSAIGRTLQAGDSVWRVVGVAADARVRPGVAPRPKVYEPLAEWPARALAVRVDGDAAALAPALRTLVSRLDAGLVDVNIRTLASINAETLARPRFYTTLFSSFGLTALLLALVGVYGTTAYAVRARTREIGIRMALGAQRGRVVAGVMGRTLLVVGGGIAVGLGAAALGSRALTDVLVMVEPRDVFTYATVANLVLAAGAVAALVPAGRASRVDAALTLRDDG
jgi:predicted permease